MAIFPCDIGLHRNQGRNMNVYVGILNGDEPSRWALRLCQSHWGEIQPHLSEYEVITDGISAPYGYPSLVCVSCGQPIQEDGRQIFVTAYPAKNDRKDYWLQVHDQCSTPAWIPKDPMRARG